MGKFGSASDVRVGVVGYGGAFNMGPHHLREMKQAGMTPMAVADPDEARLQAAQKDFPGIRTFTSLKAMLAGCDVNLITIITPHNTHAKLAVEALRAGRHVVCEKPLAITTAECDAMIREAAKRRLVISTYHNRHWDGTILQAVKDIGGGMIGKVFRVEAHIGGYNKPGDWWRSSKSISGGVMYDWGVHLLEYSLQVLGPEARIAEVSGYAHNGYWAPQTRWKQDTVEDEGFAVVRFKNGAYLTLLMSSIDSSPKNGMVTITGTEGTYVMDWPYNFCITRMGERSTTTRIGLPNAEGWRFYQNIADHLVKGEKLVITGQWARRPIHILDLADQSARLGKPLKAKYE
jgi:predicted dehydrogenase